MSHVTGVVLHLSVMEENDMDDPASAGGLVGRINAWLEAYHHLPLERIDGHHSGEKHPQALIFVAGFNGLIVEEFVELFLSLPWEEPENAILILNPEEGDVQIIRATAPQPLQDRSN